MATELARGDWRRDFSGKELFRNVRDWVYEGGGGSSSARDGDLAKAVGFWQRSNTAVPEEVLDLHASLRARAGL